MRVALISAYFPAHRGGIEITAGRLAQQLAARSSAEITWHASDCDTPPPGAAGLRCIPARSWNVAERRAGFPYPLWSPKALAAVAHTVRAADVVHLHDYLYLPQICAFLAARLDRVPVLVTQHIGPVPYRNPLPRALLAGANRALGSLVLSRAAQTVFVSAAVSRYFGSFVRFRRPPQVVQNGVDTALFVPQERTARSEGEPMLLFVGRFVEKKGLRLLREVAAALSGVRWVFAGWGPLDPAIWKLPNVTVVRDARHAELVPLYQAADLLVLPSVGEGFPLVVQEAMACGTPALVSEETAAGCPEAADLIFSEPLGVHAAGRWVARIRSLLEAPDALAALRPRVAAFARAQWSWERCAERYESLLRDCVMEKQISRRLGKQNEEKPLR